MFTGLIEQVGTVTALAASKTDVRLTIQADMAARYKADLNEIGASIAVNGVCLTVVAHGKVQGKQVDRYEWSFDVSQESLSRTSLNALKAGSAVNLEWSLTLSKPMGGHWVSGHVDAVGSIIAMHPGGRSTVWTVQYPEALAPFIAEKGSICLDGISLTVNRVDNESFDVAIIPHTQANTTIACWQVGTEVNIEIDLIARYLYRFMQTSRTGNSKQALDYSKLAEWGYVNGN